MTCLNSIYSVLLFALVCDRSHDLPSVPRPPNCRCPNRENGRLMVTISGVTWRITMVAEGFVGKSCGILDELYFFSFSFRLLLAVALAVCSVR